MANFTTTVNLGLGLPETTDPDPDWANILFSNFEILDQALILASGGVPTGGAWRPGRARWVSREDDGDGLGLRGARAPYACGGDDPRLRVEFGEGEGEGGVRIFATTARFGIDDDRSRRRARKILIAAPTSMLLGPPYTII